MVAQLALTAHRIIQEADQYAGFFFLHNCLNVISSTNKEGRTAHVDLFSDCCCCALAGRHHL